MNNKLHKMLDDLGPRRRVKDGGFAEVTEEDLLKLSKLFYAILEAKFEKDYDNDLPVEFKIINRRKYEHSSFLPIPYTFRAESLEKLTEIQDAALCNLGIATDVVKRIQRLIMYELLQKEENE